MNTPQNTRLYEHQIATFWFDEEGILYAVSKKNARTIDIMKDYIAFVKKMLNNRKACIISDITHAGIMDKQTRDFTATQLHNVFKAMALISSTHLSKSIGTTFLTLDPPEFPTKMFTNEKEAKEWIRQYL